MAFAWFWIWPKQIHSWFWLAWAFVLLAFINGNWWGVMAMPIILSVRNDSTPFPRFPRLFWIYYPALGCSRWPVIHGVVFPFEQRWGRRVKYLLFGAIAIACDANAQHVYKCVDSKEISYQSEPCSTAKAITKIWQATPDRQVPVDEQWQRYYANKKIESDRQAMRERAANISGRGAASGTSIPVQQGSACAAAKRYRQSTLDAAGISRTHDLLRSLDDAVYRACK